jgi:serine/threonine-protein kinase
MATVHFGRLLGPVGFSRAVAIKRLHPHFARDPEFVTMFLEEARLAARIRHPNVVSTLDVVATKGELFLVMDYVLGESLARLQRTVVATKRSIPVGITRAIVSGVLHGLHEAHEARNERGEPLGIVHRDVSPQNIMVGVDGVARVLDFGIAKAAGRSQVTREGQVKGKIAYMAPERIQASNVDRRCDIYAAAVVLWEMLTGQRLIVGDNEAALVASVLTAESVAPSKLVSGIPTELDAVALRGLDHDPAKRFPTARAMAVALEASGPLATSTEVGEWVEATAHEELMQRAKFMAELEQLNDLPSPSSSHPPDVSASDIPTMVAPAKLRSLHTGSLAESSEETTFPYGMSWASLPRQLADWVRMGERRKRVAIAAGSSVLLMAALAWLLVTRPTPARTTTEPATFRVAASQPLSSALPAGPTSALRPTASTPLAAASAGNGPETKAPGSSEQPRPLSTKPISPKTNYPASSRPGCQPPYTVDEVGHRHYKRECL